MNQLISHPSKTMSSRELLTIINVCRAEFDESPVRLNDFNNRVVDELDGYHYESFVVNNPNGTQSTEHRLTIDQCILVGMRESKAVRRKVLEKLTDMKSQQTVPQVQVVGKAEDATRAALLLSQPTPLSSIVKGWQNTTPSPTVWVAVKKCELLLNLTYIVWFLVANLKPQNVSKIGCLVKFYHKSVGQVRMKYDPHPYIGIFL